MLVFFNNIIGTLGMGYDAGRTSKGQKEPLGDVYDPAPMDGKMNNAGCDQGHA